MYLKNYGGSEIKNYSQVQIKDEEKAKEKVTEEEPIYTLESAINKSKRVNFVVLGMEDIRSDTMIFVSFEPVKKQVDLISVPRDTYLYRKGYEAAEMRKINAVYASHGINGVKKAVTHVLGGVPVHYYVMVDYDGVKKIVDSVGGVDVTVPFHMKYTDPSSKPPLYIDIPKGKQTLNGDKSIDFLRYRKQNGGSGGYKNGDLGRVKAQQEFLKSFLKKSLSIKLPVVIKTSLDNVKTDIAITEAFTFGKNALGIDEKNINFSTLPGIATFKKINGKNLSYYIYDEIEIKKLMESIYGVVKKPSTE
ncbi:LCP family protein [Anaerosalibacter sp. Marseille-P3206]|uniref:LCP family protein n=1 Tax=Anaerosalibacter sp. Marseille-P3206 TaxID=1871005 RepID=UPI0013566F43|nr:LCP family protein [Anaerosalibacter sp. Marseille-P3206]